MHKIKSKLKIIILLTQLLMLTSCVSHVSRTMTIPVTATASLDEDTFDENSKYLYTPPTIYRTWLNARVNSNNEVVSAHYRYWVADRGHWNIPIHTASGSGSELLGPATR